MVGDWLVGWEHGQGLSLPMLSFDSCLDIIPGFVCLLLISSCYVH